MAAIGHLYPDSPTAPHAKAACRHAAARRRLNLAAAQCGNTVLTNQRPSLWHSLTADCPTCAGTGRVFTPEVVTRRLERSLKRAGHEHRERQLTVRLHPEVALYLLEEEPKFLQAMQKLTGLDLELRDDPTMRLDEFRLMSRPAGRDVTDQYAVA